MGDANNKITAGEITFYSHWLPALAPGEYAVSVKPEFKGSTTVVNEKKKTVTETFETDEKDIVRETFHVDAPRWALTGSEVYSCYPSPGEIGEFSNALPHIVFDRCTLPWERAIDGTDPTKPHDPWLALILLTDADFALESTVERRRVPSITTRKLSELLDATDVIVPKLTPDPYDDKAADLCQTIDLPAGLFSAVMPRKADLQYLAHVREVNTDNKETWSLLKEGKFSVIVGNRFPETQQAGSNGKDWGIVNTVFLISLEGWGEYLENPDKLDQRKNCRLLVLGSWRFTCQGSGTFKSLMEHLNDNRLLSRPPLGGDVSQALTYLNAVFDRGFTPVNHDLRNNDSTISWYRGPLAPVHYEKSMSYTDISCADAALRYDPKTGMFDSSYAAAWQLGRLLALQDQAFAQALFGFRTAYQRWIRRTNTEALREMAEKQEKKIQHELGGKFDDIRNWYVEKLQGAGYFSPNGNAGSPLKEPSIPATVQNWLGQAMLLYGVPFQYLVPDEEMLPLESIRFFYMNPEWLNSLLQGACSVGRTTETDELADQFLRACFFKVSEKLASQLRSSAKQEANAHRDEREAKDTPAKDKETVGNVLVDKAAVLHWPLSGYLLRSASVESWIGLEAKAQGFDRAGRPLDSLQILRMDRLAPDILLCIYNGKVTEIEVKQPAEAIHFGAARKKGGGYEKTGLRKIKGDIAAREDRLDGVVTVETSDNRVVQVKKLAEEVKTKLGDETGGHFSSAEFALEMIESPAKVTFSPELTVRCPAATTGQVDVAYSSKLVVFRGAPPYICSIVSGSLPPGLTLNPSTGEITGTPTTSGTYNFTAKVVDSGNPVAGVVTKDCSVTIREPA